MRASRAVLLAATFAALLLVMGASATAVWWNARAAQATAAELHDAHLEVDAALASVRSGVYLIAVLTRDYLLDSAPGVRQQYTEQFNAIRNETERSFDILEQSPQIEDQREALVRLKLEIQQKYWEPTVEVLGWTPEQKQANRAALLDRLVARRREVMRLSSNLEQLIAQNFDQERQRAAGADQDLAVSFGSITLAALLLGLGISVGAWARMNRLERQSQAAEFELRRLTGQIRMAQEMERKNLSRELHDEVGQILTRLRMDLGGISRIGSHQPEMALRLESAKRTVEDLIRSIRNIALLLRPSMLDDLGLSAALAWLVKQNSRSGEFEIHADVDPAVDSLPEAHRTCLYRVVQEALTNVSRHAGARKAELVLKTSGGWVIASIVDDGRGFPIAPGGERGLGLIGMEERVKELGGTFDVVSAPGRGTRVELRLPQPETGEVAGAHSINSGRPRDRSNRIEASA